MIRIATVVGARPQFIKASTVSRALASLGVEEILIHTGQHYDANMSSIFFEELAIPLPKYNLGIVAETHGAMTGRQLEGIEALLVSESPQLVIVYGDTNSTLAGALAAAKLHIPVAHVEAGLRSFNRQMPEEINRVLTDHLATVLFAPTHTAVTNLSQEGIAADTVHMVGDVMYDAALFYKDRAKMPVWYQTLAIEDEHFVLCTVHRAENTDDPARLKSILTGLGSSGVDVILPLHPRTKARLRASGQPLPANIQIVEPVSFLEMVWLEMRCSVVVTDSGGVQKEAFFHRKPCVTLRDETEWLELIEGGYNRLVGTDPIKIADSVAHFRPEIKGASLYGCGDASAMIVQRLCSHLAP